MESAITARWRPAVRRRLEAAAMPLAVAGILLLSALLRLWGLGAKSLWFDEAYSIFIAQQPPLEILRLLQAHDTHPPLHYLLLHVWITLFGKGEVAVRLPSVLASVGAVLLTFLLGRRIAGQRVALLAALFLALSPFQITSAQEARMYPFLTLFAMGSMYSLWLALEEGGRWNWVAYVGSTLLGLATHYFAFLVLLVQAMFVLALHRDRATTRSWLGAMLLITLLYLPFVPLLVAQIATARNWPNIRPPFGLPALADLFGLFSFGGGSFGMGTYFRRGLLPLDQRAPILLPFVALIFAGVAGLDGWRKRTFLSAYWIVPVAIVSVISLRWNIFYERYFSFVLPPFAVLIAAGVFTVANAWSRISRVVTATMLIVLAAYMVPALADVYRARAPYNWRGAAQYVAARVRPNDLLLFIPAFSRIPFDYYFRGPNARVSLSPKRILGGEFALGDPEAAEVKGDQGVARIAAMAQRHPRLWIIATIPLGYERRMEVNRVLTPYYREIEGLDFGQVFTFLWKRRQDGQVAP